MFDTGGSIILWLSFVRNVTWTIDIKAQVESKSFFLIYTNDLKGLYKTTYSAKDFKIEGSKIKILSISEGI